MLARVMSPRQRLWALVTLCDARQRALSSMRFARFVGVTVALFVAIPMVFVAVRGGRDVLDAVALRGLALLSWGAAGLAALAAAGDLAGKDRAEGVEALARQRGYRPAELATARVLAAIRRIATVTGVPALALCALALAMSGSAALAWLRLELCVAVVAYVLLLAAVLGGLARWSARVSPGHGRWLLLALLLVPELARAVWTRVPGVIEVFGWVSHQLLFIGARGA